MDIFPQISCRICEISIWPEPYLVEVPTADGKTIFFHFSTIDFQYVRKLELDCTFETNNPSKKYIIVNIFYTEKINICSTYRTER